MAALTPEAAKAADVADTKRIRAALKASHGNVSAAAEALGVPLRTLHRRIVTLGLREWLSKAYPRSARQPSR